jgi:hypothetical protein
MASGTPSKPAEKSILSSAVESIYPWASSRTATPTPADKAKDGSKDATAGASNAPEDHSIPHLYGQSTRSYPPDCPPLNVQWFHAVDVQPSQIPEIIGTQAYKITGAKAKAEATCNPHELQHAAETPTSTKEVLGVLSVRFKGNRECIPKVDGSCRGLWWYILSEARG